MRRRPHLRPVIRLWPMAICLLAMSAASTASAELVILSDGRVVKATSHQVIGDELEIALLGGGSFRVERARIERIVEDEVATAPMGPQQPGPAPVVVRPAPAASSPRVEIAPASAETPAPNSNHRRKRDESRSRGAKTKHGRSN